MDRSAKFPGVRKKRFLVMDGHKNEKDGFLYDHYNIKRENI